MIRISEAATKKIKQVIKEEGNSDLKLRIFVQGGGCSGFQYGFTLEEIISEDDFEFTSGDVSVLVDPISMQYLTEAEIDYEKTMLGSEFKIKNPNAKATCGCGSSFTL
jgi:iron-sulfur cluster insertion protein